MAEALLHAACTTTLLEPVMNRLFNRLLLLVVWAVSMGPAQALDPGSGTELAVFPTGLAAVPSVSNRNSFADLFSFTVGAQNPLPAAGLVGPVSASGGDVTLADLLRSISDPPATETRAAPVVAVVAADGRRDGSGMAWMAAIPEPAPWMLLLCGLVTMGFMARRRLSQDWPTL